MASSRVLLLSALAWFCVYVPFMLMVSQLREPTYRVQCGDCVGDVVLPFTGDRVLIPDRILNSVHESSLTVVRGISRICSSYLVRRSILPGYALYRLGFTGYRELLHFLLIVIENT